MCARLDIHGVGIFTKAAFTTEVHSLKGNLDLEGRGDDIDVVDVSDTVTVHRRFWRRSPVAVTSGRVSI